MTKISRSQKGTEWKINTPHHLLSLPILQNHALLTVSQYVLLPRQSYLSICIIAFKKTQIGLYHTVFLPPALAPATHSTVEAR